MMIHLSRRLLILVILATCLKTVSAQEAAVLDSLKIGLSKATTTQQKFYFLDNLSKVSMNVNIQDAEKYGNELIQLAEESRDRRLMVQAYISNGVRCGYMRGQKEYLRRAEEYLKEALSIAQKNNIDDLVANAELRLANYYLTVPDRDKAFSYANQAFSLISTLSNDSLRVEGYNAFGSVYLARNEKTIALRNYLAALRAAENISAKTASEKNMKAVLMRSCYLNLSDFYRDIDDIDKAIDYKTLAYKMLSEITDRNVPYSRVIETSGIGNLFSKKKNYDLAIEYYERSIKMADSLKFTNLKIPAYISLLNQYLQIHQPQKALDYMNSPRGTQLKNYLANFGLAPIIDQAYAVIYNELKVYDSARKYFARSNDYFENNTNEANRINYYGQLADFYRGTGDREKAISYLLKVKDMGDRLGLLEVVKSAAKNLDTLYSLKGDFKQANYYSKIFYNYKDSIDRLNREKELSQEEAADEQQRVVKAQKDAEEREKRMNNIQYTAITIGIIFLFILLAVLGMFRISAGAIKAISFFTFLMLFEFIFLVFKKNIHSITHGEPWKDLAFMIGLAALLVPLHHWAEHRVLKYLTSHNLLTSAGHHIKSRLMGRTKRGGED